MKFARLTLATTMLALALASMGLIAANGEPTPQGFPIWCCWPEE